MKRHVFYRKNLIIIAISMGFMGSLFSDSKSDKSNDQADKPYRQALYLLWSKLYPNKGSTLYCGYEFDNTNKRAKQNGLNAEHIFPMSWVSKELDCGTRKQCQANNAVFRQIESDLHNIYPVNSKINQARSNYPFAQIKGENWIAKGCDFEVDERRRVAEPRDEIQGEIARAMLYMEYFYALPLFAKNKAQMLEWDKNDPPNDEEIRRNKLINALQGRNNPFISLYPFRLNNE